MVLLIAGIQLSSFLMDARAAASPRVEIFVASWCPYCQLLEQFLKSSSIPYIRQDIDKSVSAKNLHEKLGGGGIPVTRIDGTTIIRGFNPPLILEILKTPQGAAAGSTQML